MIEFKVSKWYKCDLQEIQAAAKQLFNFNQRAQRIP